MAVPAKTVKVLLDYFKERYKEVTGEDCQPLGKWAKEDLQSIVDEAGGAKQAMELMDYFFSLKRPLYRWSDFANNYHRYIVQRERDAQDKAYRDELRQQTKQRLIDVTKRQQALKNT